MSQKIRDAVYFKPKLFAYCVAWAAQVFFRIANKEETLPSAGFASLMEGRTDGMKENDYL